VADWGDGVSAIAAPWVQLSVSAGNGWPHNALRHHWLMPISWHFRDCKALLVTSLTHLSGAITSVQTFTFTFTYLSQKMVFAVSNTQLTQREFTDAGETPHCPHLFIKIKYKTIRHILLVPIYLQFRLGRL